MNTLIVIAGLAVASAPTPSWDAMMTPPSSSHTTVSLVAADSQAASKIGAGPSPDRSKGEPTPERLSDAPAANPAVRERAVPPAPPAKDFQEVDTPPPINVAPPATIHQPPTYVPALPVAPLIWSLADSQGQVWTHTDRAWLESWVYQRNQQIEASRGTRFVYYSQQTRCQNGTCR